MRFRRFKKTMVMMLILTLIMPNFTSVFADTSSKVHVSNAQADLIGSITVNYGAVLPLELIPQGASTFAASDNGDNVNDNLIDIIINFLSGETQVITRATLIAEGKMTPENPGSLNVFIEDLIEIPTYTISGYIFEDVPPTDYSTVDTNRYVRVSVTLTHGDEDPIITNTDDNGYYEFTDLEPGTYTVNVTDTGGVIQDPQVSEKDSSLNEEVEVTVGPDVNDVNFGYYTTPITTGTVTILKDVPHIDNDSTPFWVDIYPVRSQTTVASLYIYDEQTMEPLTLTTGAYMAVETTNPNYTTTYPSLNFSVYEGLNTTITFVNVFIETPTVGGLQIYKDVPNVEEDPTVFEFNIFIPGETEPYKVLHGNEEDDAYTRLPAGLYHVSETPMEGYMTTTPGYRNIEVVAGEVTDVYFENIFDDEPEIALEIEKTVEDSTLRPGQDAVFTVEVTNTGSTTLSYIIVTDEFEDEDSEILIEDLELGPGESWSTTYTVEDLSVGNYTNVAIAQIIEVFDPIEDDADVSVRRNPPDDDDEYSVRGYVFEDINEDNDVNGDDFGYSGITVELYDSDDDLVDTDVTDSNGRYSFSDLNGKYTVIVDPFGDIEVEQVSEYDGSENQSVDLSVTSNKSKVNFGYFTEPPLALPTIIAGTVFNDINEDNMVDTGEIGYSNVEVTLWSGTTPVLTKMTDANGQYVFNFLIDPELADLEPGDYIVSVGQIPVGVTEVSEYDATLNLMVQLTIEEDTEAIVNVNYGFKTNVVPSGEEANVAMLLMGLFLLSSGVILRKKSYAVK